MLRFQRTSRTRARKAKLPAKKRKTKKSQKTVKPFAKQTVRDSEGKFIIYRYGVFHSQVVIEHAIWDWIGFLAKELQFDLTEWLIRCLPSRSKQIVVLPTDAHTVVPEGSTIAFDFSKDLSKQMIRDVKRRAQDS